MSMKKQARDLGDEPLLAALYDARKAADRLKDEARQYHPSHEGKGYCSYERHVKLAERWAWKWFAAVECEVLRRMEKRK